MTNDTMFPPYIPRTEEQRILTEARLVRKEGLSRAVLLYGAGGVGKTQMLREMATTSQDDPQLKWLAPIDIDDAEYWLLSNLERRVISELGESERYFGPYLRYLRRLPGHTLDRIDRETVVSHLDAIKQEFVSCYTRYAEETKKTIVIVFDTVEVIRGLSLLYTLTEWMKSLPSTLFVLSGRPPETETEADSIQRELAEGKHGLSTVTISLDAFSWAAAHQYLGQSEVAGALSAEEKKKLVLLTRGFPLWLAFTIDYLMSDGLPKEVSLNLADLERNMPYGEPMTTNGNLWHELYKRTLVTPFQSSDFQHEAIKRLAVVRQNVSPEIWERLMADRAQEDGIASLEQEWDKLLLIPWIRPRSNNRLVTLHDAVAEEISLQLIPKHDPSGEWRRNLWQRAAQIYADLSEEPAAALAQEQELLNSRLQDLGESERLSIEGRSDGEISDDQESSFVTAIVLLDGRRREFGELRVISLHYQLLSDAENGAKRFLELFEQALKQRDPLPRERLAVEIQRFLPHSTEVPLEDVVGQVVKTFREWLENAGLSYYQQIVKHLAKYQIETEQPQAANKTIGNLPDRATDPALRFDLNILKGNALMRIPGESQAAEAYFSRALKEANAMTSDDAVLQQARAHKDFGFYWRQRGKWRQAMESYGTAFSLISAELDTNSTKEYRQEMASIERNWAYVNAISGNFGEATNLIESAIRIYRNLGDLHGVAAALSVRGEVHRYGWQFTLAWRSFAESEHIFDDRHNRAWLGIVRQEQAICLLQAHRKDIELVPGLDPKSEAKRLIEQALTICREQNLRAYPSALNRAARIFGEDDIDAGLVYAKQGIDWAVRLSDGWKWTACLVEYVDLNYRGWVEKDAERYRQAIRDYEAQVEQATATTDFLDLRGKWKILQGHLKVEDLLREQRKNPDRAAGQGAMLLDGARENYMAGFTLMADTFIGSSSAFAIGQEFDRFRDLFQKLPGEVRESWITDFRRAWRTSGTGSTVLLALLEELY
jgi:tetratricopeptide (TPR) repeat protein